MLVLAVALWWLPNLLRILTPSKRYSHTYIYIYSYIYIYTCVCVRCVLSCPSHFLCPNPIPPVPSTIVGHGQFRTQRHIRAGEKRSPLSASRRTTPHPRPWTLLPTTDTAPTWSWRAVPSPRPPSGVGTERETRGCNDCAHLLTHCALAGYSLAFGIVQEYYATHLPTAAAAPSAVASIGTTQTGVLYLMMPLSFTLLTRRPGLKPWCGPLGLALAVASLVASSYVNSVAALVATQGVLYALGCGLLFSPASLYLDDWFVARKGLAYGVMWASKSLVGVVMPFAMRALLDRYGLGPALRLWAVASVVLALPLAFLLKPRRRGRPIGPAGGSGGSNSGYGTADPPVSFSFLRSGLFWMLQIGNIAQALGYQMPMTYLPSYADAASSGSSSSLGPPPPRSPLPLLHPRLSHPRPARRPSPPHDAGPAPRCRQRRGRLSPLGPQPLPLLISRQRQHHHRHDSNPRPLHPPLRLLRRRLQRHVPRCVARTGRCRPHRRLGPRLRRPCLAAAAWASPSADPSAARYCCWVAAVATPSCLGP